MKQLVIASLIISTVIITACKKKKHSEPGEESSPASTAVTYPDYAGLKVSNYWIYQRFRVDDDNTVTPLNDIDSCYIIKDTLIRDKKFYIMHRHDFIYNIDERLPMSDSLHCIIGASGNVIFSSEDFTTVFFYKAENTISPPDTAYTWSTKMDDKDLKINTPAGEFISSNMKTTVLVYPAFNPAHTFSKKYMDRRYSKNIGLILETEPMFLSASFKIERRLIRYHLN